MRQYIPCFPWAGLLLVVGVDTGFRGRACAAVTLITY